MVGGNISVLGRIKVTLSNRKRIKARGARDGFNHPLTGQHTLWPAKAAKSGIGHRIRKTSF